MTLTDEQAALMPSDDDVKFYREHGYYLSKKIYTDEQIESALRGADRFYTGKRENIVQSQGQFIAGWTPAHGDVLRKNDYASLQNRELFNFVRNPLVGAIASRLSGSPTVRLWHDQLLWKPVDQPDNKANVGWHTDRGYWKTCTSSNLITAWVPFHDCDEAMGTITMIDGSHKWPDNTEKLDFFSSDLESLEKNFDTGGHPIIKVPANLKKGCVSFHHCLTIHGSGPNRSTKPRQSIAIHMQDQSNRWQEYRRGDGSLATHWNDRLCRKVDGMPDYTDPVICPPLWE